MSNLYEASNQWANRPADERYWNLADMYAATQAHRDSAAEAKCDLATLSVRPEESTGNLIIAGQNSSAILTHHCFGQVAAKAGAPAEYLRGLSPELACANINHGLIRAAQEGESGVNLLIHRNGGNVVRSMTSDQYSRIWNADVCKLLQNLSGDWRVPPARPAPGGHPAARPATESDILPNQGDFGLSVKLGDMIAPAGLYASDHDCFVFMVNENCRIADGTDSGMARGFFVVNSEVGGTAFKVVRFAYRHVCGNHIVWNASNVDELRIVHRGSADRRFAGQMVRELSGYANESPAIEEGRILAAKNLILADSRELLVERLFKSQVAPRKTLEASYDLAIVESDEHRDIDPRSAWGMAQGMTALARDEAFTDKRATLERSAGKILSMAF